MAAQLGAERLLEDSQAAGDNTVDRRQSIIEGPVPKWGDGTHLLFDLKAEHAMKDIKEVLSSEECFEHMVEALDPQGQYTDAHAFILTVLYDLLREDSSAFDIIDKAFGRRGLDVAGLLKQSLLKLVLANTEDTYVADHAAWLMSAIMGHCPNHFTEQQARDFASALMAKSVGSGGRSELGRLEALTNVMKANKFRAAVLSTDGAADFLCGINQGNVNAPTVYRRVFAMWLVSFDKDVSGCFSNADDIVTKMKLVLTSSRVEKVVRLALTVLTNFLDHKSLCESMVELGVLDVVQQLEYEKWRDSELYEQIRDVSGKISQQVNEMSNFERYEKELASGHMRWGFIHSSKFWQENIKKFEANDFKAVKDLAAVLNQDPIHEDDYQTTAVACHDMGEFVTLHPQGKKIIAKFLVKERVMALMAKTENHYREVRREALLCCQKIMLNKWQDMKAADASK